MSDEGQADPAWVYWKARALLAGAARRGAAAPKAPELLESIASPRGFYEQLALEDLGRKITVPGQAGAADRSRKDRPPARTRA